MPEDKGIDFEEDGNVTLETALKHIPENEKNKIVRALAIITFTPEGKVEIFRAGFKKEGLRQIFKELGESPVKEYTPPPSR